MAIKILNKPAKDKYMPGVCNIGPAEIRWRRQMGWLAAAVTIGFWLVLMYLQAPADYFLLVGLPGALAASGFIQAHMHFCAGFGVLGVHNMGGKRGQTESASQAKMRQADQLKALQIMVLSALVGITISVIAFVLL